MKYSLLVVGYQSDLKLIEDVIAASFESLEVSFFEVSGFPESDSPVILDGLSTACSEVNGVLCTRKELYVLLSGHIELTIPARYIEIDAATLEQLLLRVRLHTASLLHSISADAFETADLLPLLSDRDIFTHDARIQTIPFQKCFRMHLQEIIDVHRNALANGADVVLTCFPDVYAALHDLGLPVYFVQPSTNNAVQEIRNLKLGVQLHEEQNRLAYIYLCLRYKRSMIDLIQVPMRETDELTHISNSINLFARSIDAAAISLSRWEYVILCDESRLLQKTKNYSDISLLQRIASESIFDGLMAIGIAKTAKAAHANAMIAYSSSVRVQFTNSVVTTDEQGTLSPTIYKTTENDVAAPEPGDHILHLAQQSGTSYASLQQLYLASIERDSALFTSKDIADLLNISVRSANRFLQKLLDHNCATISSSVSLNKNGRPNRLIRLHF